MTKHRIVFIYNMAYSNTAQHGLLSMIISFKHKGLEKFFSTGSTVGIQAKHATKLQTQLTTLDSATTVQDMNFPNWYLHPLQGNKEGYWSIRVNGNWRIIFKFEDGNAYIVDYLDYH